MICKIITKHVGEKAQTWDKHLNAALWAYRTSFKASLGYTPFHLVYGQEAILPIEVELSSLRVLVKKDGNVTLQMVKWKGQASAKIGDGLR